MRVLVALAAYAAVTVAQDCVFSKGGLTYDLSEMVGTTYHVTDDSGDDNAKFDYFFQVCGRIDFAVETPATAGTPGTACIKTPNDDSDTKIGAPQSVFQLAKDYLHCRRLGDWQNSTWEPFENPADGFSLTMNGGNTCPNGRPRSMKIIFECYDDAWNVPDEEMVIEDADCEYKLLLRTTYGCPVQCGTVNRHLCNGHGFCGYNPGAHTAQCLCDHTYGGAICEEQGTCNTFQYQDVAYAGITLMCPDVY